MVVMESLRASDRALQSKARKELYVNRVFKANSHKAKFASVREMTAIVSLILELRATSLLKVNSMTHITICVYFAILDRPIKIKNSLIIRFFPLILQATMQTPPRIRELSSKPM